LPVDVEGAPLHLAEQHIGRAEEELAAAEAHGGAATAAAGRLDEHERPAAGAQAGDGLPRRGGRGDPVNLP
jgi:hypothetical protein